MRPALAVAALLSPLLVPAVVPSLAHAGSLAAGVGLGLIQSKVDQGSDPNHTLELFGRLGLTPRVAGQLEVQRIETDTQGMDIRSITGLVVVDLGSRGHLVPTLMAGVGFDRASDPYGDTTDAHHIEGGLGLEYRADGGLTIGAEARLGGRTIDSQPVAAPLADGVAYFAPSTLQDGEYRSVRITAAIRF